MANSDYSVELTAKLKWGESKKNIQEQLSQATFLIHAKLYADFKSTIQKQLSETSFKLNVGSIDTSKAKLDIDSVGLNHNKDSAVIAEATNTGLANANHNAQQMSQNINNATSALQQARAEAEQLASTFIKSFSGNGETRYREQLKALGIDPITIDKSIQELKNLQLVIDKVSFKRSSTGDTENIATTTIQATDQYGKLITLSQQFKNSTEQVKTQIISVTENIKQQNQAYLQQKKELENITAAAKEMWALQNDRKNPISNVGITNTVGEDGLSKLNASADVSGKVKQFKEAYNDWIAAIRKANSELETQKKISAETTIELERTAKAALTASRNALSERTTPTDFRVKDVAAEIERATADLTVFEKELSKVGMSLDDVRNKENETLRDLLQTAKATSSSNAFGKYLDQLAIAKAKLREVKAEQDNAGESIKKLQDLTSKGLFAQNPNDDRVKTLRQDIGDLATTYQQLQTQFQNEGMTESVRQGFAQLSGQLQSTSERAKELQSSLKSAKDAAALEDRKSNLNNKIETWLRNNTRASESMRQSMKSLQTQIQSADKQTLTHLTQQFNELNRTAQQTGQIGKSFMDTFKEKALKFAGWFNLANAFMMIANEAKQALVTLKDVDTILTEISKTSERSAESLERLGETAFDAASKYGVSVQNYLTGVQEMARAGYETLGEGQSEKMAELALLAQAAGDVTDSVARDYLIATDAAYQLGGSIEKLQTILDGQNKVNIKCPHIQKCMCA